MPKSCCAVGCINHNMMLKNLSFFTFPKDPIRWDSWVNAVKRVNPDETKWRPSKETALCSDHFLTGNIYYANFVLHNREIYQHLLSLYLICEMKRREKCCIE